MDTKDQITVVLKEYDALRKDIEDRVNTPKLFFVPLLIASLAGILGWKAEAAVDLILLFVFPLLLTILGFALNADFYVLRTARQVAKIEDKIFRLSGLSLLTHETEILHSRRQFHARKALLVGVFVCILYFVIQVWLFSGLWDQLADHPVRILMLIFLLLIPPSMFVVTGIRLLLLHKANLRFRSELLDKLTSNNFDYLVGAHRPELPKEALSPPSSEGGVNDSSNKEVIKMSECDTARVSYESSRNEILERIRLRDNALIAFLGATGVVFGVTIAPPGLTPLLLILPYLSLAATSIITQHDRTIGGICSFLTQELKPFLREHSEDAPTWEACDFLRRYSSTAITLRTVSHSILILLPAGLALVWARPAAATTWLLEAVWWCALVVTMLCAFFLILTHIERRKYYRETNWRQADAEARNG